MALNSAIEWTEATWNPLTGCTKVSPGCKFCYAERLAWRLQAMGRKHYENGFRLTLHENSIEAPLRWKKPRRVFVNSMSDLFQDEVPFEFVSKVFKVMAEARQHQFQILTKRSTRLLALSSSLHWSENVWVGVSVEDADHTFRIDDLRKTGARIKFLSLEPLLGPLRRLDLSDIDWVIVGGESGPGSRPMDPSWPIEIRDQCRKARVPFFFKQWGGINKKKTGRLLAGRTWDEFPNKPFLGESLLWPSSNF